MAEWNFADVWEAAADAVPDACAQVHGDARCSWRELDRRADGVAASLLGAGLEQQARVALMLFNGPEYMPSAFGALKGGLVPVNTNYRYGPDELHHVWGDADATAVVFAGELTETVAQVRDRLPDVRLWLHADDGTTPCPDWAAPFAQAAASATERVRAPWGRSGDDLLLIYTGGTTGRPKGLMWRQHDMYRVSDVARDPEQADLAHVGERVAGSDRRVVGLPAAPLMHGTGYVFAGTVLSRGGTLVTLRERKLDVTELLDALQHERVTALCIVGDAFCRPIVDALDAEPDRWDVSALRAVSSSGMAWSDASKERLLAHAPKAVLVDMLNSSEASGMGRSVTSAERGKGDGGRFKLGEHAFVVDDDARPLQPGSDEVGRVAVRGHLPLGYWKDPEKTEATFPTVDGVRCSIPGDLAKLEADGSITLLGRDATTINTGGEKVFGEEVEDALRAHPEVDDALVVGVPDERFGSAVAALVQPRADAEPTADELVEHVRARLARYKAPRHVLLVDSVGRQPNGKADYRAAKARLEQWLGDAAASRG